MLKDNNLRVKTYLIFKPPFMSEGDALRLTTKWVTEVAPYSDDISVNPMNIQRRTVVDRLYRNREYRPPWLWSLVDMLEITHDDTTGANVRMIVHPTAGGKLRGGTSSSVGEQFRGGTSPAVRAVSYTHLTLPTIYSV